MMRDLDFSLLEGKVLLLGSVALVAAVLLWLFLRAIVPREQRPRLRMPLVMLVLYVALFVAQGMSLGSPLQPYLEAIALLALLLALGRLLTIFVLDWLLGRRLRSVPPRIVRDIVEALFMVVAVLVTLRSVGVDPTSLLATSAVLTAIIGLSLQDTLGNLFAGLSLQAQQAFAVGEWIQLDREGLQIGQVVEINWRATRLRTQENVELVIPNGMLARAAIMNFSRPTEAVRRSVFLTVPYEYPTRTVHGVMLRAVADLPGVATLPPPSIVSHAFRDYGIEYWVRYFIDDFDRRDAIDGMVRDRLWYALGRADIPVATPQHRIKMQQLNEEVTRLAEDRNLQARVRAVRSLDFLRDLPDAAIEELAADARNELYEEGEIVVRQGDKGEELYLCVEGELCVLHTPDGGVRREIARLGKGGIFGELSLMTGEPRTATVQAETPCELLVIGKAVFSHVLAENPGFAELITQRLAERQAALEAVGRENPEQQRASVELHKGQLLKRMRQFFSL
jgi:small-conductance mechanosensitive channel/CRP-like cAMP-binding protein